MSANKTETSYVVAAWWRMEGYGGTATFDTRKKAEAEATRMLEQGYGDGSRGGGDEVRIIEVARTVTTWRKPDAR